jgi:hypothetical protein
MGGVTQAVSKAVGLGPKPRSIQEVVDTLKTKPGSQVSRMDEEQSARMRGARRRGRQLLSDARLSPEGGSETLGGGQSLG